MIRSAAPTGVLRRPGRRRPALGRLVLLQLAVVTAVTLVAPTATAATPTTTAAPGAATPANMIPDWPTVTREITGQGWSYYGDAVSMARLSAEYQAAQLGYSVTQCSMSRPPTTGGYYGLRTATWYLTCSPVERWVTLDRYLEPGYGPAPTRYHSTVGPALNPSYVNLGSLAQVRTAWAPGMQPLYLCQDRGDLYAHDHPFCDGNQMFRLLGFVYANPTPGTVSLWRCVTQVGPLTDRRETRLDLGCQGWGYDRMLGYAPLP